MPNTIVAGNGNTITPDFDAVFRDMVIGANGTNIIPEMVGSQVTDGLIANGLAFAHGIVAVFKNAQIGSITGDGYIYVKFTVHHDEDVLDEADIYFTDTLITAPQPDISVSSGEYNLLVASIASGVLTVENYTRYPKRALRAEYASTVTGTIAGTATAVTQAVSDDSTKVATTAFVKDAIESYRETGTITAQNITSTKNAIYKRIDMVGLELTGVWGGGTIPFNTTIAIIGNQFIWARPQSDVTVPCYFTFNSIPRQDAFATIHADGSITLNGGIMNGDNVQINCVYLKS